MKTGVIIYSITGNTRSVGQRLVETMQENGIDATLLEVKAASDKPDQTKVELIEKPDPKEYDKLVFASPVHAFRLSKVMKTYLSDQTDVQDKDVTLFVTHHFPFACLGGNSALRQMRRILRAKGAKVDTMFSINWSSKKREANIHALLDHFLA